MKRVIFISIIVCIAAFFFGIVVLIFQTSSGKGALQVTSNPKSSVYINGKLMGQTPLCKCEAKDMLVTGEYTIRLVPTGGSFVPFEEKITINKSVLTVIDRSFGDAGASQGSVITLSPLSDKNALELLVLSFPDNSNLFLDNNKVGNTPFSIKDITPSDHEIKLSKDGYSEKSVRIRAVKGYKLTATIYLATALGMPVASPTASLTASPSAVLKPMVKILQTGVGYLNVRSEPLVTAARITQVKPGEEYVLLEEQPDWYKIQISETVEGWISSQYAEKNN